MTEPTPEVSPGERRARFARVEEIFHRAAALSGPQRAAYIAEACAGDPELRREVESLLAAPDADSGELEAPVLEALAGAAEELGGVLTESPVAAAVGSGKLSGEVLSAMPPNGHSPDDSLIGQQMGPYRIAERIGVGGMGEVYRAHDAKLGRDVAIKVLPREYARDAERLARFRREARTLASLNHPNIAAIYGLEEVTHSTGVTPCLVMELVEGPTLAEKIRGGSNTRESGRPLPLREALEIAQQIATGLEHAHEKGIIHRDLKPANVKITAEGTVKLLDFGLAKAFVGDSGVNTLAKTDDISTLTHLPPQPSASPTAPGMLLGTPSYMSPEQARGQTVDKRTDIWALGCVLYEMLTGRPAFSGPTVTDILAKVINHDPDWNALPNDTPPQLLTFLQKCLQKDSSRRLRSASDSLYLLDTSSSVDISTSRPLHRSKRSFIGSALAIILLAVGLGWTVRRLSLRSTELQVSRFSVSLPIIQPLQERSNQRIAISPDGSLLVFIGLGASGEQLFLRPLASLDSKPIPGTEYGFSPFFSPDSKWIGFFARGKLMKVAVDGGIPVEIADAPSPLRADWSPDGTIVFNLTANSGIRQISDAGESLKVLTTPDPTVEVTHDNPDMLPDGKSMVFNVNKQLMTGESEIRVTRVDTGEQRVLFQNGGVVRYAPSGHLAFLQSGTLMAVPFDTETLQLTGKPVPLIEGVAQFDVSANGILVYIPGFPQKRQLVWVDRHGSAQPIEAPVRAYYTPKLSPDGTKLAVRFDSDVWTLDLSRKTLSRLTFQGGGYPIWIPDGTRIAYESRVAGSPLNLFVKPSDGTGLEQQVTQSTQYFHASSISPDGKRAFYTAIYPNTGRDLWMVSLEGDHKESPFLQTPFEETVPKISPDGKWIAYVSNESGRFEIYVRAFPGPGAKFQISTDGGIGVVWRPDGRELFWQNGDKMMAVDISTQGGFSAGHPKLLFEQRFEKQSGAGGNYDVTADGQRFVMIKATGGEDVVNQINVVLNWFEELKQKVPTRQ